MTNVARRVSSDTFKRLAPDSKAAADYILVKDFAPEIHKDAEPGSRIVQFVISSGAVDRDGDTIDPNGWDLANFQKSGVVLWGHDSYNPPIAEPIATWVEDGKLKSRCRFPTAEVYPFADTVYRLIQDGILKATSVGFRPKAWIHVDRAGGYMPTDYHQQELLEFSVVSIPANPEALLEAKSKGIDLDPYVEWVEKTLDGMRANDALASRASLEAAYKVVGKRLIMPAPIVAKVADVASPVEKVADVASPVEKGGRVLSAANAARLAKAMSCYKDGHAELQAIMDTHNGSDDAPDLEPDEDDVTAGKAPADVTSKELLAMPLQITQDEFLKSLSDLVAAEVRTAVRRAQGKE